MTDAHITIEERRKHKASGTGGLDGIRLTIFLSHLALCLLLITGLGISRYNAEKTRAMHAARDVAYASAVPLINMLLPAMETANYQAARSPQAEAAYNEAPSLIYFEASGKAARNGTAFNLAYSREAERSWRAFFPKDYEKEFENRLARIDRIDMSTLTPEDAEKTRFVRDRIEEKLDEFIVAQELQSRYSEAFDKQTADETGFYYDAPSGQIHLAVTIDSVKSGRIWLVFDATSLESDINGIVRDTFSELLIALALSSILIFAATWKLVRPVTELSAIVDKSVDTIDAYNIPGTHRKDEIGVLSRGLARLVYQVQSQIEDLKRLSTTDPLTGLSSRRIFDRDAPKLVERAAATGSTVVMAMIDADNFKLYNDRYGHNAGDVALVKISEALRETFQRKADVVARMGGEEFAVCAVVRDGQHAPKMFEKLLSKVMASGIEHSGNVPYNQLTVSIGSVVSIMHPDQPVPSVLELLKQADQALYQAKKQGRNQFVILNVDQSRTTELTFRQEEQFNLEI
jgi:diguanylate cyclase (GGDEF)-like protein